VLVAPVQQAALRARWAPTPRRWSVALAASAVMPGSLVVALPVSVALMEHPRRGTPRPVAAADPAELAAMAALVASEAVVVPGRAAAVVLAWRAVAALAAVVARAAPGSMRAASATARLVVMPDLVAPVAWAALRARWARTLRRWSVAPAGPEATPERRARVRPVRQARLGS
jgi:hypothetical protein